MEPEERSQRLHNLDVAIRCISDTELSADSRREWLVTALRDIHGLLGSLVADAAIAPELPRMDFTVSASRTGLSWLSSVTTLDLEQMVAANPERWVRGNNGEGLVDAYHDLDKGTSYFPIIGRPGVWAVMAS